MAAPREKFGKDYAASIAATLNPRLAYLRSEAAALKPSEQIASEISALYQPAIEAAGRVGEDVGRVGQAGLAAVSGLASSLPGFDTGMLADAARATGRAGGTAALTGSIMGQQARMGLASSIMEGQRMRDTEARGLREREAGALEEQARLGADWLGYAQQRQGMATTALQNRALMAELRNAPIARRAAILQNKLLKGQITAQDLTNASLVAELKRLGVSQKDIDKARDKQKKEPEGVG